MVSIIAVPLERAAYALYGSVVTAGDPREARTANHGTAQAWDALATLESLHVEGARCTASLFRCHPWTGGEVLAVRRLERHPCSTQMFAPLKASRFLLVVALGGDAPDLSTLAAFVVDGPCAITYAPGVWHHPMIALDDVADFVNLLFASGTHDDCHEVSVEPGLAEVRVPG